MKRVWVAMCMMAFVVALCLTELFVTEKLANEMDASILSARQAVQNQDYAQAEEYSIRISEQWKRYHNMLSLYITHDRLEQIDQSFSILSTNLEQGMYDEFLVELRRAYGQLEHLRDTEMPTLGNIL
jgi:hypothetical protein